MKLPKRSETHIIESDSWKILQNNCPAEWIVREVSERDYGIDCYIELVNENNEVTGDLLSVQLKGKKALKWKQLSKDLKEAIFSGIPAQTVHYWMNSQVPVFLFVADLSDRNLYYAPIKQEVRSQYSKYLNQESMSFPLKNIFRLGTSLGNDVFRVLYFKEKNHKRFIADIRMLFIHWRRYLEFLLDNKDLDPFIGVEPDEKLLFVHIYETLYFLSLALFLGWDIDSLSDIIQKDRETWKDSIYMLHNLTFTNYLPAIEAKFFQIVERARKWITQDEAEYWKKTDYILFSIAEDLSYLKPGYLPY